MTHRPILLWMTSRSRSSMVSAIFAGHGLYWGKTQKQTNGYDTYENHDVNALQRKFKPLWGQPFMRAVNADSKVFEQFQNELNHIVPSDQTCLIKTGVEYYPTYRALNPYNVFITRKPIDIANSLCKKRSDAKYEEALEAVLWRFNYMKQIAEDDGGVFVDTDLVKSGDYSQIKEAIEYCGITFNERATRNAIK